MFKIGDISPLFFGVRDYKYENSLSYRQRFHTSDRILVEVFSTDSAPSFRLYDLISNTISLVSPSTYSVNDDVTLYYVSIQPSDSVYQLGVVMGESEVRSNVFEVCSSNELLNTTSLVRYYHSSNNTPFDEIFWAGNTKLEHQFRVEAGFKSNGFKPKLDAESFRTQGHENRLLYAATYTVETLTIGPSSGVPAWFGELVNKIFCMDNVSIDGEMIVRNDTADVSMTNVLDGSQQYVITIDVEKVSSSVEGIGGMKQSGNAPAVVANGISLSISDSIKDGSILQYSSDESAFVDTNNPV